MLSAPTESFLNKHAKELLYSEIVKNGCFQWKTCDGDLRKNSLITREDYRRECVLMEFPSADGNYLDKVACSIGRSKCKKKQSGYRFNDGNGYCHCHNCNSLKLNEVVIPDIAVFWKGAMVLAIEIINTHYCAWAHVKKLPYPVYIVTALNVMKRISNTPVFAEDILYDNQ